MKNQKIIYSFIFLICAFVTLNMFQNCAGAGGGDGTGGSGDWYYHFDCNGDPGCLSTNPLGTSCGDINEGSIQSMCTPLVTFSTHFWDSPATSWCDQNPTGSTCSGGANAGAPTFTSMNKQSGLNTVVAITGTNFPTGTSGISASYCGRSIQVTSSNSTTVTVKVPLMPSCKSPITLTTAAGSVDTLPFTVENNLRAVTSSGSLILATGDNGTILASQDGITWSPRYAQISNAIASALNTVVWNGTKFLAAGDNTYVLTSTDGSSWTSVNHGSPGYQSVIWDGTQYVAGGYGSLLQTSPDGGTWTNVSPGSDIYFGLAYSGTAYVAAGQGGVYRSGNSSSWTSCFTFGASVTRRAAVWTGTEFYIVGHAGSVDLNTDATANCGSWVSTTVGSFDFYGAAYHSPDIIAVGASGTIYKHTSTWTAQSSGTTEHLYAVTWTGTQWVAVGAKNKIVTSPDGVTWTTRSAF